MSGILVKFSISRVFALRRVFQIIVKKAYLKHHTHLISVVFPHSLHATTLTDPVTKLPWLLQHCLSLLIFFLELPCFPQLVYSSRSNTASSLWPPWLVQGWAVYTECMSPFFLWIPIALSFPICSMPFMWRHFQQHQSVGAFLGCTTIIGTLSFCLISSVYICCGRLHKIKECLTHLNFPFT